MDTSLPYKTTMGRECISVKYENPVIRGFNPDPSVCRVGEDFYLAASSFEYFPGLPIYHSRNLVDWELLGHGISRPNQLTLSKASPNALGLYAPTLRHHEGRFYLFCTNVGSEAVEAGNFFIWTDDIYSEWSDPIWLDVPGIDPSLFIDDDGTVYYNGTHGDIYVCELNLETGQTGPRVDIWSGSGGRDPEGPHIYKRDGYYYLLISEGGTTYEHMMTMARSRKLTGPYEACAHNPVLTNRSLANEIRAVGHADLVQDQHGAWWSVCLGIRPLPAFPVRHNLGREVSLIPVIWAEGQWPVFGENGSLDTVIEAQLPAPRQNKTKHSSMNFKDLQWTYLFNKNEDLIKISDDGQVLQLMGNEANLASQDEMAWYGRRQAEFNFTATASFTLPPLEMNQEVGLTIFMNAKHHYNIGVKRLDSGNVVFSNLQIGPLSDCQKQTPYTGASIILQITGTPQNYHLTYGTDIDNLTQLAQAETKYLTTEVGGAFTGNFLALYASGNGQQSQTPVTVDGFTYQ